MNPNESDPPDAAATGLAIQGESAWSATLVPGETFVRLRSFDDAGASGAPVDVDVEFAGALSVPRLAGHDNSLTLVAVNRIAENKPAEFVRLGADGEETWRANSENVDLETRVVSLGDQAFIAGQDAIYEIGPSGLVAVAERSGWSPDSLFVDEMGFASVGSDPAFPQGEALLWAVGFDGSTSVEEAWSAYNQEPATARDITRLEDGRYVVAASAQLEGESHWWISRVWNDGNEVWSDADASSQFASRVAPAPGGHVYVAGGGSRLLSRYTP